MTQVVISGAVAFTVFLFLGRAFIRWYLGLTRIEALLRDVAVSLRCLPAVREYDSYFKRPPLKVA